MQYEKINEFQMNKEFEQMVKVEKTSVLEKRNSSKKNSELLGNIKNQEFYKVKEKDNNLDVSKKPRITKDISQPTISEVKTEKKNEPPMKQKLTRRPLVDPFIVGEEVELAVTYFNMAAGYMTLKVNPFVQVNGKKSYDFTVAVKSSKVFSYFYAVDDLAQTFVDFEEMVPSSYTIDVKETVQLKDIRSFFDFSTQQGVYWEKKIAKGKPEENKKREWKIEPFSQNVVSAIFYLRTFDLQPGTTVEYKVADMGKNLSFKGEVLRREKISTEVGELDTVVVKPAFEIDGVFKQVGDVFIWLTDDERKFPVRIDAKIKIGTLVLKLKSLKKE